MIKVTVNCAKSYDVLVGDGLLKKGGELLRERMSPRRLALVADRQVDALYGDAAAEALAAAGFSVARYAFPPGEGSKNMKTVEHLLDFLCQQEITRKDALVALGGGVVGDTVGFCASIYLRGIPFVQLPTTLLAAIDSSVGGKTGVNLPAGKNLVGSIWQPSFVLCDSRTFDTLAPEVFADGLAEAVKYGMLEGERLFRDMEQPWNTRTAQSVIGQCIACKGKLVEQDERDDGLRQTLNLGHTIGHAVERASDYRITHGHAVAMGMMHITRAAVRQGLCAEAVLARLEKTLTLHDLPVDVPFAEEELLAGAAQDKKRRGGRITLAVPYAIGDCRLVEVPWEAFPQWVRLGFR